jgi:FKBP-type peptidyl-prolyl cis-trans isomerase SlyD
MKITTNTVVSLHYIMKNGEGEIIEDNMGGTPIEYLHGGGSILPSLEKALDGLRPGDTKYISVSNEGLRGTFSFEVIIDAVRPAQASEIKSGKPLLPVEKCGPGCDC